MVFVKECPICRTKNDPSDMMCRNCFGDISGTNPMGIVPPVKEDRVSDEDKTVVQRKEYLFLKTTDGSRIKVEDGDIAGRCGAGKEAMMNLRTVSRQHARFTFENGRWYIEDLDSINGTFLDGVMISPRIKKELRSGQKLGLSGGFEAIIVFS